MAPLPYDCENTREEYIDSITKLHARTVKRLEEELTEEQMRGVWELVELERELELESNV